MLPSKGEVITLNQKSSNSPVCQALTLTLTHCSVLSKGPKAEAVMTLWYSGFITMLHNCLFLLMWEYVQLINSYTAIILYQLATVLYRRVLRLCSVGCCVLSVKRSFIRLSHRMSNVSFVPRKSIISSGECSCSLLSQPNHQTRTSTLKESVNDTDYVRCLMSNAKTFQFLTFQKKSN